MPDPQQNLDDLKQSVGDVFMSDPAVAIVNGTAAVGKKAQQWAGEVERAAKEAGLDPAFVTRLVGAESNWNPVAVSSKGARGLMQLMPDTAKAYGVLNLFNPIDNIKAGVAYLKDLTAKYGADRPDLVAAAYNAGPGAVDKHQGVPPYKETQTYVKKVVGPDLAKLWTPETPPAGSWTPETVAQPAKPSTRWSNTLGEYFPAAGGIAGGLIGAAGGPVTAIGGAAAGGMVGERLREYLKASTGEEPLPSTLEAVGRLLTQGAIQGGSELAGQGLMKAAGMAAHGLMDFAIRPAPKVAEEFGDIAGTALKERLPVGSILPGGETGSQQAKAALRASASITRGLLKGAAARGVDFSAADLARGPVTSLIGDIAKQPLSEGELQQVSSLFSQYLSEHPDRLSPEVVKDMKQAAQAIAKPIYRAIGQGNVVPAGESLKAGFNAAVAQGAKEGLETIPGVGASEARTQALIGASRAIKRAEVRRLPLVAEIAAPIAGGIAGGAAGGNETGVGEGVGTALLIRALLSPRSTSRAALTLTQPMIQQALRQMPRVAVYSLLDGVTGPSQ